MLHHAIHVTFDRMFSNDSRKLCKGNNKHYKIKQQTKNKEILFKTT